MLFEIEAPTGRFHLLMVHFQTIRGGLEGLRALTWNGVRDLRNNRGDSERESTAARAMVSAAVPSVVVGDFNLPVESSIYRSAWRDFENAFSRCGWGFGYTKFTSLYGIRIDHVLASQHWACTRARVLHTPYDGDHAPLLVDLQIR